MGLLSSLTSPQVSAPKAPFTEAPPFEVCSTKARPRHFVLHQHFSKGTEHRLCGPLNSYLNRTCCHCRLGTTEPLAFRVRDLRPISQTRELS